MSDELKTSTVFRGLLADREQDVRMKLFHEQRAKAELHRAEAEHQRLIAHRIDAQAQVTLMEAEIYAAEKREFCDEAEAEISAREAKEEAERVHDKAIAALEPTSVDNEVLLETQSPSGDDEVRKQAEGEARPIYQIVDDKIYINGELSATSKLVGSIDKAIELTKQLGEMVAPQIPEGFIPWSGGECPVAEKVAVEVLTRAGNRLKSEDGWHPSEPLIHPEDEFRWEWLGAPTDIIAYRIITDAERPSDESQATDHDRVEHKNLSVLHAEARMFEEGMAREAQKKEGHKSGFRLFGFGQKEDA